MFYPLVKKNMKTDCGGRHPHACYVRSKDIRTYTIGHKADHEYNCCCCCCCICVILHVTYPHGVMRECAWKKTLKCLFLVNISGKRTIHHRMHIWLGTRRERVFSLYVKNQLESKSNNSRVSSGNRYLKVKTKTNDKQTKNNHTNGMICNTVHNSRRIRFFSLFRLVLCTRFILNALA